MEPRKVLIVIPAYNEGKVIGALISEIKQKHPSLIPLVVNDGSTDNTKQEALSAGALVLTHPFNLGIGGAVQTGYQYANAHHFDAVVQIDGDGQHDPNFLNHVLSPVLSGQLDLCIGSRFLLDNSNFKSTPLRRFGIKFFCLLLNAMIGVRLSDPTSGFRATGKKLIPHFADYYPIDFPEPEAIKMAKRFGAAIGEVPVNMRHRSVGRSSIRYLSSAYYMIKVTLAILIDSLKKGN